MIYAIKRAKDFKKSFKKLDAKYQEIAMEFIYALAHDAIDDKTLINQYRDHQLKGDYKGYRECHIKPDLLLIYKKQRGVLILTCVDIGSHSELF
ncbi:type II toxin-antitoxin system YafQ family toxin [Helicobacter sp. MIT 11-5569]|uniref:type II toxin-antitoxin system YafQ family toxin n=1 Tax=Helicobacter sp. MIT 11-5569 TaxID=1548151 RepID=UPI00051FC038|nr:type II toxin-antitoxin system YafQ family toxin [Helicobacter sp. MIT 11-5569]TLD83231.1 type II toxin-antitoxin system YafQ family toxin [Helicobacter sp. MIT 11-5569]